MSLDHAVNLGVRASMTALSGLGGARLPILIFHRVLPRPDVLFPQEMHAERFDRLMRLVAGSMRSWTLGEGAQRLFTGCLPPRSVVITFDDGYADNESVALPILQRHGLKATFFVSTGFLGDGLMWNDAIIECIRRCRSDSIDLQAWGLGRPDLADQQQRRAVLEALLPRVKYQTLSERQVALEALHRSAGRPELPRDLMMSRDQVRHLCEAGMEVGAHTVHHPILQQEPDAIAQRELEEGRAHLQAITGTDVDVLAYPNGKPGDDYRGRHVAMAHQAGFRFAVSTSAGVAHAGSDPLQLPRFTPWDQSPARWMARLVLSMRQTRCQVAPP
jgi:peptidoglycan/xylan/chitin deacetylase (PgdA/CDA1 family)